MSAASCLLLFAIARRLFGVRTGIAAAAVLAVHGMLIMQAYELLPATFAMFFGLAAVLLVMIAAERKSPAIAAGAGGALGVAALFVATLLPFGLLGAIALRRAARRSLALVAGAVVPIAPVSVRN